jgi:hypothetical protein
MSGLARATGLSSTDYAVIVQSRNGDPRGEPDPAGWNAPIAVGPFVTLERIPHDDAEEFVHACSATGAGFEPVRQSGQLYSFVRRDAPEGQTVWHWDPDEAVQLAIAFSRFVRDNSHCTEIGVRTVAGWANGRRQVAPLDIEARAFAYRVITPGRDYLDDTDAREVDTLLRRYYDVREELPERIRHALWLAEYMTRTPYILIAFIYVVSALEALLNTSSDRASAQFVKRMRALGGELEIDISGTKANKIYELRSHAVHGVRVDWVAGGLESDLLLLSQRVLRAAIRRAIEQPAFAALFDDDSAIDIRWPI